MKSLNSVEQIDHMQKTLEIKLEIDNMASMIDESKQDVESVKIYLATKLKSDIDNIASMIHESKNDSTASAIYAEKIIQSLADNILELFPIQAGSLADNSVNSARIVELANAQDKCTTISSENTDSILDLSLIHISEPTRPY